MLLLTCLAACEFFCFNSSGAREVPKQWKNGASFPTLLQGKDLKLNYAR